MWPKAQAVPHPTEIRFEPTLAPQSQLERGPHFAVETTPIKRLKPPIDFVLVLLDVMFFADVADGPLGVLYLRRIFLQLFLARTLGFAFEVIAGQLCLQGTRREEVVKRTGSRESADARFSGTKISCFPPTKRLKRFRRLLRALRSRRAVEC